MLTRRKHLHPRSPLNLPVSTLARSCSVCRLTQLLCPACRCLAKAIKYKANMLTMVNLNSNLMDDDKLRLLVTGLLDNDTVTHIDISHNRVADRGARALARLLGETSVITSLNLCDNEIHGEGGKALGRVLAHNRSLLSLNLRMNRLGDDGGRLLCDGATPHPPLPHPNAQTKVCVCEPR